MATQQVIQSRPKHHDRINSIRTGTHIQLNFQAILIMGHQGFLLTGEALIKPQPPYAQFMEETKVLIINA